MNPKTSVIKIRKCELCEVQISQFHHFYPATRGTEKTGSISGMNLCPNHHYMANILQLQIEKFVNTGSLMPDELTLSNFSHLDVFFDKAFKGAIPVLLMGYDVGRREHLISIGVYE